MDAFSLLKADHRKVEELFEQLEAADGKSKLQVFAQIKMELDLHTHIEEKIFYPAIEKPKPTHDLTLEAYEEHDVVKKLLRELSRAKTASEEWEAKAKVLQENVEHHVEEEENELFPKAADVLGEDNVEALGVRMETEKERQMSRGASKKSSGAAKKSGAKKSAAANKSASKTKAASTAAKRAGGTKKASKSKTSSGSKKSAKTSRKR